MAETFPIDAVPVNGWVMELPGMVNPHITKVAGVSRKTGTIEVVDGGSNRKFFFSDGILEHSPLTITRRRDNSPEDKAFNAFFETCRATGGKINGTLVQFRHGAPACKIKFQGLLMNELAMSDFDVDSGDAAEMEYTAQCDFYEVFFGNEAG